MSILLSSHGFQLCHRRRGQYVTCTNAPVSLLRPKRYLRPCKSRLPPHRVAEEVLEASTTTHTSRPSTDTNKPSFTSVIDTWSMNAEKIGDYVAVMDPHRSPAVSMTYRQLEQVITEFAAGLRALGLSRGDKVSLFSESSARWIVADQGIMMNGAADAVRGAASPAEELAYILTQSESSALVVQDAATLAKLLPHLTQADSPKLRFVVTLWDSASSEVQAELPYPVLSYEQVLEQGRALLDRQGFEPARLAPSDLATLVYTSGTTGHPKGVMLSHANLMYQVEQFPYFLKVRAGDSALSLLPPWHIYERAVGYHLLHVGTRIVYTSIKKFRDDLTTHPPDHFVCVPLVLDSLYNKVMAKLTDKAQSAVRRAIVGMLLAASRAYVRARRVVSGVSLEYARTPRPAWAYIAAALTCAVLAPLQSLASKLVYSKVREALGIKQTVVSGGGSLAPHLDEFFEMIGLTVLNGWGLTETSPVLACRRTVPGDNVRGTAGLPIPGTQLRVVDPDTLLEVPPGEQGLLLAKGPGVMSGYYRDDKASDKAFRAGEGWFDTGDLGWVAPAGVAGSAMGGHLVLTGRAKDTIVLSSGKNVEPQPLEDAISSSAFIKHVIVVGQDKRELGALVFPDPDALASLAKARGLASPDELPADEVQSLLEAEVLTLNRARGDFRAWEHIAHIAVMAEQLSPDNGTLTRSMKPRRPEIMKRYSAQVEGLRGRLRG